MKEQKTLPAIVLNDYNGAQYATWVKTGRKTIETRTRLFTYTGDIVICCGNKSVTDNAGKALCIVEMQQGRVMTDDDAFAACIGNNGKLYAFALKNLRHFSYDFKFTDYAVKKNFQGIFSVRIPDFVEIINVA